MERIIGKSKSHVPLAIEGSPPTVSGIGLVDEKTVINYILFVYDAPNPRFPLAGQAKRFGFIGRAITEEAIEELKRLYQ